MKKVRKQMLKYLIYILIFTILIIGSVIFVILQFNNDSLWASLVIVLALILTFILMKFYNEFNYLKHEFVMVSLIENNEKPIPTEINIADVSFERHIIDKLGYKHYKNQPNYSIYYKVDKGLTKRKSQSTLYAILLYKKELSFIDDSSNKMFEDLEKSLYKKEKYRQRVFLQLKQTADHFTKENIEDTNKIFFISHRRNNIVVLNLLFSKKLKELYYLHSNTIKQPSYLNIAYEEINKLLNE